ncbi:cobalamin biosynthesis protein [Halorhodospira halochloris]|uniref:cobalamin biosynthesis protein n=1 Tax=Halorhodospira halochloris TaxID=1052 RepID=UPI001EE81732|nr:cobalamin biosynthesis protein [Halorhodospira halochloris]MCG5547618.1 cobalamin biosynthesis protein [Halorhodospira halochloris]
MNKEDYPQISHPRVVIGIGCDRGAERATVQRAITAALQDAGLDEQAVAAMATIDIKKDEHAITDLAHQQDWPLFFYSAAELAAVSVPHPSATVARHTGTPAVAEAAALLHAGTDSRALLIEKRRRRGSDGKNVTVSVALINPEGQLGSGGDINSKGQAPSETPQGPSEDSPPILAAPEWRSWRQGWRHEASRDGFTASSTTGQLGSGGGFSGPAELQTPAGKILVIGIGPGDSRLMSQRARQAIAAADVVIGYKTYLDLIAELLDAKRVISKGMTEELERAEQAYTHALLGNTVALISSGDAGVYGMAAPIYELLIERGQYPANHDDGFNQEPQSQDNSWQEAKNGRDSDRLAIDIEVIPGITALSASASLVGAPLSHDFCTISLSDLLTPWPVIARRLEAAARGDFVVALYNPASKKRTQHIKIAQQILLRRRSAQTPVAVIRSAYRDGQSIEHSCLGELHRCELDMLSTVLIGNSSTYQQGGYMITPRGYRAKYGSQAEHSSEQAQGSEPSPHTRNQRGKSLPLGLEGWHAEVRAWLRSQEEPRIEAAMEHFDAPRAEILTAVAEQLSSSDDPFTSRLLDTADLSWALDRFSHLPLLQATTATPHGVVLNLNVAPADITLKESKIELAAEQINLSIDTASINTLFLLANLQSASAALTPETSSLELCDIDGNLLLSLFHCRMRRL